MYHLVKSIKIFFWQQEINWNFNFWRFLTIIFINQTRYNSVLSTALYGGAWYAPRIAVIQDIETTLCRQNFDNLDVMHIYIVGLYFYCDLIVLNQKQISFFLRIYIIASKITSKHSCWYSINWTESFQWNHNICKSAKRNSLLDKTGQFISSWVHPLHQGVHGNNLFVHLSKYFCESM